MRKTVSLLLMIMILMNISLQPCFIYANNEENCATLELRCINITNPNNPINVGDIFEIQIIGNKVDDLYGYCINLVYDSDVVSVANSVYESAYQKNYDENFDLFFNRLNISVPEKVYQPTVTQAVYGETVTENVYNPYIHPSLFEGLETFNINTNYENHIGSESNGVSLNGLNSASFVELLKGKVRGIDISNAVLAGIRFKALKEAVMPLLPSNELMGISNGANVIIQMANSFVGNDDKISYAITLPYRELIIGSGTHTLPKTYSFVYSKDNVPEDTSSSEERKTTSISDIKKNENKFIPVPYDVIWEKIGNFNKLTELEKTLLIVKKQRDGFPKIEYQLDEEEVLSIIKKNEDNLKEIVLSIPVNEEYESNNISVSLSLSTLKKIKESSKKIILRCDTLIGSSQINFSSINYDLAVDKLGKNINTQLVNFTLEISQAFSEQINNSEVTNTSMIDEGIHINAYMKYGRKKQTLLNLGDWLEYIMPYQLERQEENSNISCLLVQNEDITVIPVKTFEQEGGNFIKIKTLCSNGTFYPMLLESLIDPKIEIDKHTSLYMKELIQRRVFKGYNNGKLQGYEPLTRSQCVVLLSRLFGMTMKDRIESDFKDVEYETWYSTEIEQVKQLGWVNGYNDGTFRPNNKITAQEMAIIIDRIINWNNEKEYYSKYEEVRAWTRIQNLSNKYNSLKYIFSNKKALITRNQASIILKILEEILQIG